MGSGLSFDMLGVIIILSNKFIILVFSLVTLARLDGIPTLAHENEEIEEIIVKNPSKIRQKSMFAQSNFRFYHCD